MTSGEFIGAGQPGVVGETVVAAEITVVEIFPEHALRERVDDGFEQTARFDQASLGLFSTS